MGMVANMLRVTKEELDGYFNDSSLLEERVYSSESLKDTKLIDLDKSWEGIFYMLTGKGIAEIEDIKSPFVGIVFSEKIIDEEHDLGYGPANYIDPDEVKALNNALKDISVDEFKKKYQPKIMNDLNIYPTGWGTSQGDVEYLIENFIKLKSFYEIAAKEDNFVINFIN